MAKIRSVGVGNEKMEGSKRAVSGGRDERVQVGYDMDVASWCGGRVWCAMW